MFVLFYFLENNTIFDPPCQIPLQLFRGMPM